MVLIAGLINGDARATGGLRGLQIRCTALRGAAGGFDSHTSPPFYFMILSI